MADAMNMNRDASDQCIDSAKSAIEAKDFDKAMRMIDRSLKLYPNAEAQLLKQKVAAYKQAGATRPKPSAATPSPRRTTSGAANPPSPITKDFTPEQQEMVRNVKRAGKDYYKILGVPKDSEDNVIKKAYRRLALKLHPDKNTAPGADDAFKLVGTAYACLSDSQKRAGYDRYGTEDPSAGGGGMRRRRAYHEEEINPEDIFNMFFGMPAQGQRRTQMHRQQQRQPQEARQGDGGGGGQYAQLIQLMPLLLLFLFSVLGNNYETEHPFRLSRTPEFTFRRETVQTHTPYYVKESFDRDYSRNRHKLVQVEKEVDRQYLNQLMNTCRTEKRQQSRLMQEARWAMGNERKAMQSRARKMEMKACDELKEQGYDVY